jgi:predicted Fe-Mo cluster-binding NifX family protein
MLKYCLKMWLTCLVMGVGSLHMSACACKIQDNGTLKIAIPMANGVVSEHFGGAKAFLIFEGDRQTLRLGDPEVSAAPEHKPGSLPEWLEQQKVDAVVVSAIGERALILLADAGIEAFLADGDVQPSALASACLSGKLTRGNQENSRCNGHHDHDHDGHGCHHH